MGVGVGLYMCDVVKKSSRSLSHLLMSSCLFSYPRVISLLLTFYSIPQIQVGIWDSGMNFLTTRRRNKNCKIWHLISGEIHAKLEMWANAQRDGRPAEYRWRPLFNAAKFG